MDGGDFLQSAQLPEAGHGAPMEKVFDIAQRERKSDVNHPCRMDDFTTRPVVAEQAGLRLSSRVGGGKVGRKLIALTGPPSDTSGILASWKQTIRKRRLQHQAAAA